MQWWGTVSTASGRTMGTNPGQGLVSGADLLGNGLGQRGKSPGDRIELGEEHGGGGGLPPPLHPMEASMLFDVPQGTERPEDGALRNDVTMVLRLRLSTLDAESLRASFEAGAERLLPRRSLPAHLRSGRRDGGSDAGDDGYGVFGHVYGKPIGPSSTPWTWRSPGSPPTWTS